MRIYAKVIPKASQNRLKKISEGEYKIWVTAPPIGGKANEAVIKTVADYFGVAKSCVEIKGGKTAKIKIVDILL